MLATGVAPPDALRQMIRVTRQGTNRAFGVNLIIETTALGPLTTEEHLTVCIDEHVSVVTFFWTPPKDWVTRLKEAGCDVWLQTRSTTGLSTLLPRMVDALGHVPVLAAGGVADGRGMAAALCLGAAGVCVGTRMIATLEANAHAEYRRRVVEATENDISRTCIFGSRVAGCVDARDTQQGSP